MTTPSVGHFTRRRERVLDSTTTVLLVSKKHLRNVGDKAIPVR